MPSKICKAVYVSQPACSDSDRLAPATGISAATERVALRTPRRAANSDRSDERAEQINARVVISRLLRPGQQPKMAISETFPTVVLLTIGNRLKIADAKMDFLRRPLLSRLRRRFAPLRGA